MVPSVMSTEMLYKANNHTGLQQIYCIWGIQKRGQNGKQLLNAMSVMEVDKETIFSLVRLDTFTK
jgi:hypothetical protein